MADYEKTVAIVRRLSAADPASGQLARDLVNALVQLGRGAHRAGDLPHAKVAHLEGLQLAEIRLAQTPNGIPERSDVADALLELGRVETVAGSARQATEHLHRAASLFHQLVAEAPLEPELGRSNARALEALAQSQEAQGAWDEACPGLARAHVAWRALEDAGVLSSEDARRPALLEDASRRCELRSRARRR